MSMLTKRNKTNTDNTNTAKAPRDRFILGKSECYFESAQYLTGMMDAAKVKSLLANPETSVKECEGQSLKVLFHTDNEIKFVGFITAGDASLDLDNENIDGIMQHALTGEITKAVMADELVNMF